MHLKRIMTKKPVAKIQAESNTGELKRTLSAANLVSLGIGCIIGAGIFVITGQAAADYAGPAITISFVLAGICCAFAGLCYAELASMLPVSGSAYSYAYASLGEVVAWTMGWLLLLEYGVSASAVAVGWSGYVVSFLGNFGVLIPEWLTGPTFDYNEATESLIYTGNFNLPAMLGIWALMGLLVLGVKESATVNNIIVFIKVAVILLFIVAGAFYVNMDNLTPFIPENLGEDGKFGWSGITRAAGVVFFAYVGFEAVSTASQEAKNPQKDVPIGILGSLVVCTALYMLVSVVLTGIVPYQSLAVPDPMAVAVDAVGLGWLSFLVKIGAIAGLSSVMMVLMYAQTRVFYTMSRDGLLPQSFSKVHPKYQTPYVNTLTVGTIIGIVAATTPIGILADLVSLGTLCAFAIICFSVFYLRTVEPDLERPFKVPLQSRGYAPKWWVNIFYVVFGAIFIEFISESLFNYHLDYNFALNVGGDVQMISWQLATLFAVIAIGAVFAVRMKRSDYRSVSVPMGVPMLGILSCGYLIVSLLSNPVTVKFYILYLITGIAIYMVYGMRKSKLHEDAYE